MRHFITMILVLIVVSGCAGSNELVKTAGSSSRQDVFQEIAPGAAPMPGYADLSVYSSLKTHKPGIYSAKDIHGTADYKITLDIDGQAVELHADLQRENIERGEHRDPEAGKGIRYNFSNKIRIMSGTHRVVIAIPSNGLTIERVITLTDGSSNILTLEPVYKSVPGKQRPGFYGVTSFTEGLKGFRVIMNGNPL